MKIEEYIESELFGIFRVKLVAEYIKLGYTGTRFMYMNVKTVKI